MISDLVLGTRNFEIFTNQQTNVLSIKEFRPIPMTNLGSRIELVAFSFYMECMQQHIFKVIYVCMYIFCACVLCTGVWVGGCG
jgi:hypothetical protein